MISPLPDELWLDIFSLAVHVPGLLDTKWNYPPNEQLWEGWRPIQMTSESRATRVAIVQVSRTWWRIGRRFVYEVLDIWSPVGSPENLQRLEDLVALFELDGKSAVRGEEGCDGSNETVSEGYGSWVKRIDVAGQWLREDMMPLILGLVNACHNIRIVSVSGFTIFADLELLPILTDFLQSRFAHSLRRLSYQFPETEYSPTAHQSNPPNVQLESTTLALSLLRPSKPDTGVMLPALALTTITSLELLMPEASFRPLDALPEWTLPALRYLSISGLRDEHVSALYPFLKANGESLLGVRFNGRCSRLPMLLEYSTAIESLVFDDINLELFNSSDASKYPSVTCLGITGVPCTSSQSSQRIGRALSYIISRNMFPNLGIARILADVDPKYLQGIWDGVTSLAAIHGITLEDRHRRILRNVRPEGLDVGENHISGGE